MPEARGFCTTESGGFVSCSGFLLVSGNRECTFDLEDELASCDRSKKAHEFHTGRDFATLHASLSCVCRFDIRSLTLEVKVEKRVWSEFIGQPFSSIVRPDALTSVRLRATNKEP